MPYLPPNTFTGGWNTDDDLISFPKTDWVSASYVRPADIGLTNVGQPHLVSAQGNTIYPNMGMPAGTNIVIGSARYDEADAFIVFYYNSNGDHSIWKFFNDNNSSPVSVLTSDVLNFQLTYKIWDAVVVNGVLKWTDGYFATFLETAGIWGFNPPRELDIEKAINGDYVAINRQTLDVIKYPPTSGPIVAYATDTTEESNKLYGYLFQFIYRYGYDTDAWSVWSPISECPLPNGSEYISGRNFNDPAADNYIEVTVNTGPEIIKSIQIAVRNSNTGQFGIFSQLDKAALAIGNNTTYVVDFYNSSAVKPVEFDIPNYDLVPQVSDRQELVPTRESSSVMAYAGNREGYDIIETEVIVGRLLTELEGARSYQNNFQFTETGGGVNTSIQLTSTDPVVASVMEGDVFSFAFNDGGVQVNVIYTVTAADITAIYALGTEVLRIEKLLEIVGDYCASQLGTTGAVGVLSYSMVGAFTGLADGVILYAYTNRPTNPTKTVKTGFKWQLGIQYYDRGLRDGSVLQLDPYYVPFPSQENTSTFTDPTNPYTVNLRLSINHIPPPWANTYQVVAQLPYIGFMQRSVKRIQADGTNRIKMSLENFYLEAYGIVSNNGLTGGATINYTPAQGDVVRFIRQQVDTGTSDNAPYCEEYIEVQVLAYSDTEGEGGSQCVWVNYFDAPSLLGGLQAYGGFVVEIYRPIKASDTAPYFEISEEFAVLNPYTTTRAHAGNIQNQVNGGVVAISVLDFGDVYLRPRNMGTKFDDAISQYACWWIEDPYYSDYYKSDMNNRGRLALENPNSKNRYLIAEIRHSKSAVQNTQINGLNTFTFEDKAALSEADGAISRIMMLGETLKVLQPYQETSIYIQQAYSVQPDGSGNTAFTDRVFGGVRRMDSDHGCDWGGLVVKYEGAMYYFDRFHSCVVRSSGGGQQNICEGEYKFVKGGINMKETYELIEFGAGTQESIAAVSGVNKEIQFWFGGEDGGTFVSYCYVFSLRRNRWIGAMDHNIRYAFSSNDYLYCTTDQNIYVDIVSSSNMNFNNIDAEDLTVRLSIVFSDGYTTKKAPLNMAWYSNTTPSVYITSNMIEPYGLQSLTQILPANWSYVEGTYVAPIGKDMSDPAFSDANLAYINGRVLRANSFSASISMQGENSTTLRFYGATLNIFASNPIT